MFYVKERKTTALIHLVRQRAIDLAHQVELISKTHPDSPHNELLRVAFFDTLRANSRKYSLFLFPDVYVREATDNTKDSLVTLGAKRSTETRIEAQDLEKVITLFNLEPALQSAQMPEIMAYSDKYVICRKESDHHQMLYYFSALNPGSENPTNALGGLGLLPSTDNLLRDFVRSKHASSSAQEMLETFETLLNKNL